MFDEQLFTFVMDEERYFDGGGMRALPGRSDADGSMLRTDTIRTKLKVLHHPSTAIPGYRWEKKAFWFYTASSQQIFEVEIVSHQMFGEYPRFHASRIESNGMQYIESVDYDIVADNNWRRLQTTDQNFPPHTRRVRFNLRLPNQGVPVSFDLCVFARDRENNRNINCDPQVGNAPPDFHG